MNSKGLSLSAIDQLYGSSSNDPILILLHMTFPVGGDVYLVNNTEDITSNGQLYTSFPFKYSLPNDSDEDEPVINVTLSNVGLDLIDEFRNNTSGITAEINMVFASNPDFVEISLTGLEVKAVGYNLRAIQMTLAYNDILSVSIPSYTYSPTDFPGLFNV